MASSLAGPGLSGDLKKLPIVRSANHQQAAAGLPHSAFLGGPLQPTQRTRTKAHPDGRQRLTIKCGRPKQPKNIIVRFPDEEEAEPCIVRGDQSFQTLLGRCRAQALKAKGFPLAYEFDGLVEDVAAVYEPVRIEAPRNAGDVASPKTITIRYRVDTPSDALETYKLAQHEINSQGHLNEVLKTVKGAHLIREADLPNYERGFTYKAITLFKDLVDGETYYAQDTLTRQYTELENRSRNRVSGVELAAFEALKTKLQQAGVPTTELPRAYRDSSGTDLFECEGVLETPYDIKILQVKSVMTKSTAELVIFKFDRQVLKSNEPELSHLRNKKCSIVLAAEYVPPSDAPQLEAFLAANGMPILLPNGSNWGLGSTYLASPRLV